MSVPEVKTAVDNVRSACVTFEQTNILASQLEIACKALTLSANTLFLLEHAVKSTLPKVPVTSVDRALLVEFVEFLGTVTEEFFSLEGQLYVTLSQNFGSYKVSKPAPGIKAAKTEMSDNIKRRYPFTRIHRSATMLDPRFKG